MYKALPLSAIIFIQPNSWFAFSFNLFLIPNPQFAMHGSLDQSFFPYNSQTKNPRNVQHYYSSSLRPAASLPPPARGLLQAPPTWPPFQQYLPYAPPLLPLPPANPRHNKQSGNGGRSSNPKKVKTPKQKNQKNEGRISPKKIDSAPVVEVIGNGFSSSAIYAISPPPSSLPLPTFSLRRKFRCNAAAGIDSGATDNLRDILRLR